MELRGEGHRRSKPLSLRPLTVLQETGGLRFMVSHTSLSASTAAPTAIYATVDEDCGLFLFTAGSYSSVAVQTLGKGTVGFCHYLPSAAGCIVKNMAGL